MNPSLLDLSGIPHYSKVNDRSSNLTPRERFTPSMMRSIGDLTNRSLGKAGKSSLITRTLKTPELKIANIHTNAMRQKIESPI